MPSERNEVDLFVIGGGSGGVRAARISAGYGAKVMLAEEFRLGGTCVIRGCVPKKLYVYASRFPKSFADAKGFGWSPPAASFDWPVLVAAKEREITRLEGLYGKGQENAGVEVVKQRARLVGPHEVELADGRRIKAGHILIATGGRPHVPAIPGAEYGLTSNEVFDLPKLPRRILIAGAGYIALEFAGIFAGLGAEVTVIHRGPEILRGFDHEIRAGLRAGYEKRGIRFLLNNTIEAITPRNLADGGRELVARTKSGDDLVADVMMAAVGRVPNTDDLGLETAGVVLGKAGEIVVDRSSRTNVPHIYAVGDVTNRIALTPVAIREGHAFADSVFGGKPWDVDHSIIPTAVFTTPEIGTVGLTEEMACAAHAMIDIYRTDFRPMTATLSGSDERVFMKLVVDGETDRVLGVHIMGEGAGEMIQLAGIAMKMGARKRDFDETMAVHPTAAEELVTMRTRATRHVRAAAE